MILNRGSVMRYGSCKSQAPALLAGSVVARPQGRPLVASSRLADALLPLGLRAVGRAVPLPRSHRVQMTTSRWQRAQFSSRWLSSMKRSPPPRSRHRGHCRRYSGHSPVIALAVAPKPRPAHEAGLGFPIPGGSPVLLIEPGQVTLVSAGGDRRSVGRLTANPLSENQSQARTTSTVCASREPNQGHAPWRELHPIRAVGGRREPDPERYAPRGENHIQRL